MRTIQDVVVSDTETTGFDPANCSLLEVAACGPDFGWWHYVDYEGDIPADARSAHHISPDDVRPGSYNCMPRAKVIENLLVVAGSRIPVFHNAEFDLGFLPELKDREVICTYRCALHMYPDAPNLKNQTLRYWLGVEPRPELIAGLAPHRGLYDSAVTLAILGKMLESRSIDQLIDMTKHPVLLTTVRFGKYKGLSWKEVPRDYRAWMRRNGNWETDRDVMFTLDVLDGRVAA